MKKSIVIPIIFIILVLSVTLSGCKKKTDIKEPVKDPIKSTEDGENVVVDKEKIMKEFDRMIKNRSEQDEIVEFIDKNIEKLSQIEGDLMVTNLEGALNATLSSATDKLFELDIDGELMKIAGTERFFPEDKLKDIQNEKLREEVTRLFKSKLKLINLEGQYYPIIDYEKIKQYNNYISDEIKEYIAIKAMDSNGPVVADGGLTISYDELAGRIIKTEEYISKYSGGQRYEVMLGLYRDRLNMYLNGLPNTPIANYETKKIYQDVFESYKKTSNVKDSITAFVVTKYINIIEENKLIINDNVKDKVLSLVNEALSSLESSK